MRICRVKKQSCCRTTRSKIKTLYVLTAKANSFTPYSHCSPKGKQPERERVILYQCCYDSLYYESQKDGWWSRSVSGLRIFLLWVQQRWQIMLMLILQMHEMPSTYISKTRVHSVINHSIADINVTDSRCKTPGMFHNTDRNKHSSKCKYPFLTLGM